MTPSSVAAPGDMNLVTQLNEIVNWLQRFVYFYGSPCVSRCCQWRTINPENGRSRHHIATNNPSVISQQDVCILSPTHSQNGTVYCSIYLLPHILYLLYALMGRSS